MRRWAEKIGILRAPATRENGENGGLARQRSYLRGAISTVAAPALVCAALMFGACRKTPGNVAQTYLVKLRLYDYSACYQALSSQDRAARTLDAFVKQIPLAPEVDRDLFKSIVRLTDYEVGAVRMLDEKKAIVPVKVSTPDLMFWERTVDAVSGEEAPESVAEREIENNSYPKLKYYDDMVMVRERKGWKIHVDFLEKEKIAKLHKEALEAYHKANYAMAIALYRTVITQLDTEQATGNKGLKFFYGRELRHVERVNKESAAARAYIAKVILSEVDVRMSASHLPGIFGKVTNRGSRALDEVKMTVTYYVGQGKEKRAIFVEEHRPIARPIAFADFKRPLLPLAPGEIRNFGFNLTAPADVQRSATPDVTVTSVVFAPSKVPLPKASGVPPPLEAPAPVAANPG